MNKKTNKFIGLMLIFFIVLSSVSFADNGVAEERNAGEQAGAGSAEDTFKNNPTPENLANIPNPTIEQFNRLNPAQQAQYLILPGKYNNAFAQEFYAKELNLKLNPELNNKYMSGESKAEQSRKNIEHNLGVAAKYFSDRFKKSVNLEGPTLPTDFFFDVQNNVFARGGIKYPLDKYEKIIGVRVTSTEIILIPAEGENKGEIKTTGKREGIIDYREGSLVFVDKDRTEQKFAVTGSQPTEFDFAADGTLTVKGSVSGTIKTKDDFAKFSNYAGTLVIYPNGDFNAENAEVVTSKLYADGYYKKRGNIIEAWDVGDNGKKTVIIDRTSCVDFHLCIGARTQGQVNPTAEEQAQAKKIKKSTLTVHLNEISPNSQFAQTQEQKAASEKQRKEEKKGNIPLDKEQEQNVERFRRQAQELRKPCSARQGCTPLEGNNAEVFIHRDEKTGVITASSRGSVEVGLFDTAGDKATALPSRFHYSGKNGNSELDAELLRGRNNYNVLGQGDLTAEYQSVTGEQDGSSVKFTTTDFSKEEMVRADCFNCKEGKAATIKKKVAFASALLGGLFSKVEPSSVTLTVNVGADGKLNFEPSRQDLGILASQRTERILREDPAKRVIIGNNFFMEIPCGEINCGFQLTSDPQTGEPGAKYWKYDPKTKQKQEGPYSLTVQKVLGREVVISSQKNIDNFQKFEQLMAQEGKQRNLQQLSELSFDKTDPGYEAWRKKVLQERGIDPSRFDDKTYVQNIGGRVEQHEKALAMIEKLGIRIDERGLGVTPQDQERINQILSKASGYNTEYDQLSRALLILARNKADEIADELKSCAGTTYCTVSQKDLKAAENAVEKIVKQREGAYFRLVKAEEKFAAQEGAKKRQSDPNKGMTTGEKAVAEELGTKIKQAERRKISAATTLTQKIEDKKEQTDRLAQYIRENFNRYQIAGVRFDKLGDPEYRKQVMEDYAQDHPGLQWLHADLEYTEQRMAELSSDIARAEQEETRSRDSLNAVVQGRLGKQDDVAAEMYSMAGQQEMAKQVAKSSPLIPEDVRTGLVDRYSKGAAEDSFEQVRFLASNGRLAEAQRMQERILTENPQAAELAPAAFDSANKEMNRVSAALLDQRRRELEAKTGELQRKRYERKYGAQQEFFDAARSWGTGGSLVEAIQNPRLAATNLIESSGRLVYAGAMDVFKDLEDSGSYILGHTFGDQSLSDAKASLERDAERELERQQQELAALSERVRAYGEQGKTAAQAFADARKEGQYLGPEARLIELQTQGKDTNIDVHAAKAEIEQLQKNIEKYPDHPDRQEWMDRVVYLENVKDLQIAKAVVDAENEERNNYNTFALAEEKWKIVAELDPSDPRAKIAQQRINQLDRNVLGEVYGERAGWALGLAGIELSERTSRTVVEDLAISTIDPTLVFDIAEAGVAVPAMFIKVASKVKAGERTIQAARQVVQRGRYALYGSEKSVEVFDAARKALQLANSDKQVVEATKTFNLARKEWEAARGTAREGQLSQRLADAEKALRSTEDAAGVTKARTELALAEAAAEADIKAARAAGLVRKQTLSPSALDKSRNAELDNIAAKSAKRDELAKKLQSQQENLAATPDYREAEQMTARTIVKQTSDELNAVKNSIAQSEQRVDELDGLAKATSLAGTKASRTWERALGKIFPAESTEVADAKKVFRQAQDDFVAARNKVDLVGSSEEAARSRIELERARNQLEKAAAAAEKAQDGRKSGQLFSSVEDTARYYQETPRCSFVGAALGLASCMSPAEAKLSKAEAETLEGLAAKLEQGGARLEVVDVEGVQRVRYAPETVSDSLRADAGKAEQLIAKVGDDVAADVRIESALQESFANSEFRAAQEVKKGGVGVPEAERAAELPPQAPSFGETAVPVFEQIPGENSWNSIISILDSHPGVRLEPKKAQEFEKQMREAGLLFGSGAEGIVVRVPPQGKAQLVKKLNLRLTPNDYLVIKVRNTELDLERIVNSFPRQKYISDSLAERGLAPRIFDADDSYYIAEEIKGPTLRDLIRKRLTEEQRKVLNQASELAATQPEEAKLLRETVINEAKSSGKLDDLIKPLDELSQGLADSGVNIVDWHWNNIKCVDDQCTRMVVIDMGLAIIEKPTDALRQTYKEKNLEAILGGGFERDYTEIMLARVREEPTLPPQVPSFGETAVPVKEKTAEVVSISDVPDPCLVAGGAIAGMAPCVRVVTGREIPPAEISGVRLKSPTLLETTLTETTKIELLATPQEENVFELAGKKYTYNPQEGWTSPRFFGFGKKKVNDLETIVELEATRLSKKENLNQQEILAKLEAFRSKKTSLSLEGETPPSGLISLKNPQWNDVVSTIEQRVKNSPGSLPQTSRQELINNAKASGTFLGEGSEGIVLRIPEDVQVSLGIDKPSVIKIRDYRQREELAGTFNPFPEQAKVLDELSESGATPKVYFHGDNYYVAEEVQGETVKDFMLRNLNDEQRKAYEGTPNQIKKEQIIAKALSEEQKTELEIALNVLVDRLGNRKIVDFHNENIKLVRTADGGLEAKVIDVGASLPNKGTPEELKIFYKEEIEKIMGGEDYRGISMYPVERRELISNVRKLLEAEELPPEIISTGEKLPERVPSFGETAVPVEGVTPVSAEGKTAEVVSISDVVDPCAVTGGAIAGMAPCVKVVEATKEAGAQLPSQIPSFGETAQAAEIPLAKVNKVENIQSGRRGVAALGDLHGNYDNVFDDINKLDPNRPIISGDRENPMTWKWTGGDAVVVQVGDIYDRGLFAFEIRAAFNDLAGQARKAGGRVVRLLGNHEMGYVQGELLGGMDFANYAKIRAEILGDVRDGRVVAAAVVDGEIYTHAGISVRKFPEWKGLPAEKVAEDINLRFERAVANNDFTDPIFDLGSIRTSDVADALRKGEATLDKKNGYVIYTKGKKAGTKEKIKQGGVFWLDSDEIIDSADWALGYRQLRGHEPIDKENFVSAIGRDEAADVVHLDVGRTERYGGGKGAYYVQPKETEALPAVSETPTEAARAASQETRKIFQSSEVQQLSGKTSEELYDSFLTLYKQKTIASSPREEGVINIFSKSQELATGLENVEFNYIQGWVSVASKNKLPYGNRVRIYLNSRNADSSHQIMRQVAEKLNERKIPFKMKSAMDKADFFTRTDNTVLYIDAADGNEVARMLVGLDPGLLDEEVPLFTKKIGKGISWGEEPTNLFFKKGKTEKEYKEIEQYLEISFGSDRAGALSQAYTRTGGKIGPEFDDVVRRVFEEREIDPEKPWLNFGSDLEIKIPEELPKEAAKATTPTAAIPTAATSNAYRIGDNLYTLNGKEYTYDLEKGWTTPGFLGFGKKKVTDESVIAQLEVALLRPKKELNLPARKNLRMTTLGGTAYYGKVVEEKGDFIVLEKETGRKKLFGLIKEKEQQPLPMERIDETSIIEEGDEIRFSSRDGKIIYAGKYAGEDDTAIKITYKDGRTFSIKKEELDLGTVKKAEEAAGTVPEEVSTALTKAGKIEDL
ncbi:MAG: T3SS effector HopA1 family protein [Nanoarchaeota archaeon]